MPVPRTAGKGRVAAEMGTRLRPVIEAEDALDDTSEVRGKVNRAGAAAEVAIGVLVVGEIHAECRTQRRDGSGKNHSAAGLTDFGDGQIMLVSESFQAREVFGIGAVICGELFGSNTC